MLERQEILDQIIDFGRLEIAGVAVVVVRVVIDENLAQRRSAAVVEVRRIPPKLYQAGRVIRGLAKVLRIRGADVLHGKFGE